MPRRKQSKMTVPIVPIAHVVPVSKYESMQSMYETIQHPRISAPARLVAKEIFHKIDVEVLEHIPLDSGIIMSDIFVEILNRLNIEQGVTFDQMRPIIFDEFTKASKIAKAKKEQMCPRLPCKCPECDGE
jgi:hypothetical protein